MKTLGTRYRNHPSVQIGTDQWGAEFCYVRHLFVRDHFDGWLVDHPDGDRNERFNSADEAIEWALTQVGV